MRWKFLAVGTLIVIVLGGGSYFLTQDPAKKRPPASTETKTSEDYTYADVNYAQLAIIHLGQAELISNLGFERASTDEVKEMARRTRYETTRYLEAYRGTLNSWNEEYLEYAEVVDVPGHEYHALQKGMASTEDIEVLQSARGTAADETYLRLMIEHHRGAIEVANGIGKSIGNAPMQRLRDKIIRDQQQHVNQMEQILQELV